MPAEQSPNDQSRDVEPQFTSRSLSPGKKKRKSPTVSRAQENKMARELKEIYENSDGSMPDMKHFDRRPRRKFFAAVGTFVVSCLFLGAVVWAGFFVLGPKGGFSDADVTLEVIGPNYASIGDNFTYRIHYQNNQPVALRGVHLQLRYPAGFVFGDSSVPPLGDTQDEWSLPTLGSGADGTLHITGQLYGDIGVEQSLRAFMTYTPENFSSEFQKVATRSTVLASSPVTLVLGAPVEATVGSTGDIAMTIIPTGVTSSLYFTTTFQSGDGFVIKSATPASDKNTTNQWTVETPSAEKRLLVHGVFVGADGADQVGLAAIVRGWRDAKKSGTGFIYATATTSVKLLKTSMSVSLAVNGTVADTTVHPGDILTGSVVVKNDGADPQTNVVVRAIFDAPSVSRQSVLKWSALEDTANGTVAGEQLNPSVRRGIIAWDATQVSGLKKIDPGGRVTIDFQLPVKTDQDIDLSAFVNAIIVGSADVQFGKGAKQQILSANPLTLALLSDTHLDVRDEVGSEGAKEVHRISWVITNSFHELASTTLMADFYGDVSVDQASIVTGAGTAQFDPSKKKLTWTIDRLPTTLDTAALQFTVIMNTNNPTQTQLSSKVTGQAIDVIAGQPIPLVGDEIMLHP